MQDSSINSVYKNTYNMNNQWVPTSNRPAKINDKYDHVILREPTYSKKHTCTLKYQLSSLFMKLGIRSKEKHIEKFPNVKISDSVPIKIAREIIKNHGGEENVEQIALEVPPPYERYNGLPQLAVKLKDGTFKKYEILPSEFHTFGIKDYTVNDGSNIIYGDGYKIDLFQLN